MTWKTPLFLNRILQIGIRNDTPFSEVQKTKMFNLFLLIATPFAFLALVINFFSGAYFLVLLNILQLTICTISFWVSYTQKQLNLRATLLSIMAIIGVISGYYFKNGSEYRLLIMMIAAVVIFDKNWQYLLFSMLVSIGFVWIRLDNESFAKVPTSEMIPTILTILLPLFFFVMCLFYFKYIYFKNLTRLEKAYAELSLAKEQKEKILNSVAHDLRSPISNISSLSKLILENIQTEEEKNELLKMIVYSSDRSLNLINDLLHNNSAILQSVVLQPVDLNQLLSQCHQMLLFRANEKKIDIQIEFWPEILFVNIDSDKTERVISNLVNNAIKFSQENSVISLHLSREENNALLMIKDHGIGIPKENHERIFETFTNVKRKGTAGEKSFGLGLSICKQIIQEQQGTISLESEVGKGSTFFVRVPLYHKP